MHFVIADIAIENILIVACKSQVAFGADESGDIILVDTVLLGHDVEANADTLPDQVDLGSALWTLVHLPLGLLLLLIFVARLLLFFLRQTLRRLLRCIVPFGLVTRRIKFFFQFGSCCWRARRRHTRWRCGRGVPARAQRLDDGVDCGAPAADGRGSAPTACLRDPRPVFSRAQMRIYQK